MAIADLMLKAKVNMAFARDPRVAMHDIRVAAVNGTVTLSGDVTDPLECSSAEEITRGVPGVVAVINEVTCGVGHQSKTAALLILHFLEKLEEAWRGLPDQHALTQADYVRWALWMTYKFHIPPHLVEGDTTALVAEATESAIERIASYVGVPKAIIGLEMLRQADLLASLHDHTPPTLENAHLVVTDPEPHH